VIKKALLPLILILIGVTIWFEELLLFLPPSEFTYVGIVWKRHSVYEAVIEEANNAGLDKVRWFRGSRYIEPPTIDGDEPPPRPFTDEIIKIATSNDLEFISLIKLDNGWTFYGVGIEDRKDTIITHFDVYYGGEPTFSSCDDIEVGFDLPKICFGSLFGDWYYIRERINRG
jgi:hypothetical protein